MASGKVFRPANDALDGGSRYNERICQIRVTLAHSSWHVAIGCRNGNLTFLRTAGACVYTSAATRFFDHVDARSQQDVMDAAPLRFSAHPRGAVLNEGRDTDFS